MNQQKQWLFETPFPSIQNSPNIYIAPEWESDRELYEQYRRYNQQFRRKMAASIGNSPNHPLKFLVKKGLGGKPIWRKARDLRVDAGHVTPVMTMKKLGYRKERLAIQDRSLNRSAGAVMKATGKGKRVKVVMIQGVPIDYDTLKQYVAQGLINKIWLKKAQPHPGWTPEKEDELYFALGEFHDWIAV